MLGVVRARMVAHRDIKNLTLNFGIANHHGITVCALDGARSGFNIKELKEADSYPVELIFERKLVPGRYFVSCIVHELIGEVKKPLGLYANFLHFDISGESATSGLADLGMSISILKEEV